MAEESWLPHTPVSSLPAASWVFKMLEEGGSGPPAPSGAISLPVPAWGGEAGGTGTFPLGLRRWERNLAPPGTDPPRRWEHELSPEAT